ncbi:c-type cytochrome [Limobrevibacterium gyesilva]|uniref:Cytochrome c domain-containing protein n=1 Tax=Limobrevibacterium gyesilva TaxID=2991712 RepID=A0AA41YKE1_9PROT|nr:hypothetical protein [Limobrevibacterium gyesilva]MCW3475424.1 hypothetical protein [Limobrevibacterium gyesilva]
MLAVGFAVAAVVPAFAESLDETVQLCAACHGESGIPSDKTIPVIWGQYQGYLYLQLRDYSREVRANEQMAAVVSGMQREDMMALAAYFANKTWPNLGQPRAPDDVARQAQTAAVAGQCTQCHPGGYVGPGTNPRLAGQSFEYLLRTMQEFQTGARANNSWMTDLLKTYSSADIEALAKYFAGL